MLSNRAAVCAMDSGGTRDRGRFRHVQHVQPNRGPHKKGAPTNGQFFIFLQHGMVHACRPRQCPVKAVGRGELRGIHILGPPHFFLNRGPAWSKSGPDQGTMCDVGLLGRACIPLREGTILKGWANFPTHCEVRGIYGASQSYSVGGSSGAAFRCQHCSNLLKLCQRL